MKKLLLSLFALMIAFVGMAQVQCNPSFTWSQTPTNFYPYQVTLTNTSTITGAPVYAYATYTMSWGDGSSTNLYSSSATTTHNYQNAGTYSGVLTMSVYDSLNQTLLCTSTFPATITTIVAPCNTVISTTNNGSGSYTFTASNQGGPFTYSWNFGDGTTGGNLSPVTHTYSSSGTYTITLTSTVNGMTCTSTTTVVFTNGGSVNCNLLSANFTHSSSGLMVFFNNTSTTSGNTNPILIHSSHWNFGDGATSTSNYPTHTYATSGFYLVTLLNNWVDSTTGSNIYCSATDTQTIYVSNNSTSNYITGGIYWDSTLNITSCSFKVWLITFDTATNIISALDSVTTSGINGQVAYTFNNVPSGVYRTKAAVVNGIAGATSMAPTYHTANTYWGNATLINHTGGVSAYKDIVMQAGTSTSGPGFIAGNVTQGAGKGTNTGVPNLLILVRNASNQMVTFTYTDINGDYSFHNLPLGTYNIYPENMPQITTPSSSMTVTSLNTSFAAVDFIKNSHTIKPKSLGINDVENTSLNTVFPNPSKDVVNIKWNSNNSEKANVVILDITGRILIQTTENTIGTSSINTSSIPNGMYILKIATAKNQQTEKIIIQK